MGESIECFYRLYLASFSICPSLCTYKLIVLKQSVLNYHEILFLAFIDYNTIHMELLKNTQVVNRANMHIQVIIEV